jgi:hypothetical protein
MLAGACVWLCAQPASAQEPDAEQGEQAADAESSTASPPQASEPPVTQPAAEAAPAAPAATPEIAPKNAPGATITADVGPPTESSDALDEEEKPWAPWSAMFGWTQYYAAAGLSQSAYTTWNPTYSWTFLLTGSYNFDKHTSLALTQLGTVELTDSDTTAKRQQFLLYDTYLDATHTIPVKIDSKHGYLLNGLAGLLLPTSKASQAANMILGARARVGAGYATKDVLHGLDLAASIGYMRRFATTATVQAENRFPCNVAGGDSSQQCAFLGGPTSSRDITLLGLDGTLHLSDKWSAGVSLTFFWALARGLSAYDVPVATSRITTGDTSATHWRNSRWLLLFASYHFNEWLSATARATDIFAERGPDGHLRAPFNPLDTLFGLELDISFDQLYLSTRAHAD